MPETKPIDALLQELQRSRNHMAVVLDEYGGVSGLVTMEDVLEEIVGEIVDEYDAALVDGIRELGAGVCEALGRVHIDEINERLGLDLPEDADYDTIGGFVFSELGHVPVAGEQPRLAERPHHGGGGHAAADRAGADRVLLDPGSQPGSQPAS